MILFGFPAPFLTQPRFAAEPGARQWRDPPRSHLCCCLIDLCVCSGPAGAGGRDLHSGRVVAGAAGRARGAALGSSALKAARG